MKKLVSNFFKKLKDIFLNMSNFKIILIVYLLITFLFGLFLFMPISRNKDVDISFLDSLFTAASAFSDTGLSTVNVARTWSSFGQAIIAILILMGGVGIFAFKVYIVNIIFGKKISLLSKNILEKERSGKNLGETKTTIKVSLTVLFITIIIATFVLMLSFYYETGQFDSTIQDLNPKGNWALSFKYGLFHSISAINNAGFTILSNSSLEPYYGVYSIQIIFIILIVIGGIGYPVIYDIYSYFKYKIKRKQGFNFSLFTKLNTITYFLITIIGLSLLLMFEIGDKTGFWFKTNVEYGNENDKIMALFFFSFSSRNAGFSTVDLSNAFSPITKVILSIMMFIGAAPSSTAGGIRTITLALIVLSIWNKMRGIDGVRIFRKEINDKTIRQAYIVTILSLLIVFIGTFISITSYESMWGNISGPPNFVNILFEVSSAFGTTGLSTGITTNLNIVSKLYIILIMFIGQLGISSTILVWKTSKSNKDNFGYIQEDILIG